MHDGHSVLFPLLLLYFSDYVLVGFVEIEHEVGDSIVGSHLCLVCEIIISLGGRGEGGGQADGTNWVNKASPSMEFNLYVYVCLYQWTEFRASKDC